MVVVPDIERLAVHSRGGFGTVYKGWQPKFGRWVAVKVLPATFDEVDRQRAEREALAMGSLSGHPNIVPIYDAGTTDEGEPYFVMPWLGAGSLGDRLEAAGPLDWREASRLGVTLAGALEAAHAAGVIHRDVKPDNVMFSDFGEPQLADFGLASVAGGLQTTGTVISATILFAAPEILDGGAASAASDIYSLAATVYAAIAGRPAFTRGDDVQLAATIARIMNERATRPSRLGSEAVWDVLERAMAKQAARRFASAGDLASALQDALEPGGQGRVVATPSSAPRRDPYADLGTVRISGPRPIVREADLETVRLAKALPVVPEVAGGVDTAPPEGDAHDSPRSPERPRRWRRLAVAAVMAAAVIASGLAFVLRQGDGGSPESSAAGAETATSVAAAGDTTDPTTSTTSASGSTGTVPGAPEAPWAVPAVEAPEDLADVAVAWDQARASNDPWRCALYAPTELVTQAQLTSAGYAEATQVGDFQFGWNGSDPSRGSEVSESIWPADNVNVARFFDDPNPIQYADGSVQRIDPDGSSAVGNVLIDIPGQPCHYEYTCQTRVSCSWAHDSFREIAD